MPSNVISHLFFRLFSHILSITIEVDMAQQCSEPNHIGRPPTFPEFLCLPAELRERVYIHYFWEKTLPASRTEARHAVALLFCSRQVYAESRPVMFKYSMYTMNLTKRDENSRDWVQVLEGSYAPEDIFAVDFETCSRFTRVCKFLTQPYTYI